MIYLALDSGMRWSELVGLRRGQVDLVRRKVRVTEQLLRVDGEWLRRPTKTSAGVRSITISSSTAEMLERHLADRPDDDKDELVFTTTAGTPLQHSSFQTPELARISAIRSEMSCRPLDPAAAASKRRRVRRPPRCASIASRVSAEHGDATDFFSFVAQPGIEVVGQLTRLPWRRSCLPGAGAADHFTEAAR